MPDEKHIATDLAQTDPAQTDGRVLETTEGNRGELRRAAFLKAAEEVFLESGYEASSMAEIVRRAGGSLSTLYLQFGDKEGLFQAMVDERVAVLTRSTSVALNAHLPLREGLRQVGEELMTIFSSQQSIDMFRLMVSTAKRFPDMANRFTRQIPQRLRGALAQYIESRVEAGDMQIRDCEAAGGLFIDMIRARLQVQALMDPAYRPTAEEIRRMVDQAVRMFMGGASEL
jgi:AcrR family transcriptional regulator